MLRLRLIASRVILPKRLFSSISIVTSLDIDRQRLCNLLKSNKNKNNILPLIDACITVKRWRILIGLFNRCSAHYNITLESHLITYKSNEMITLLLSDKCTADAIHVYKYLKRKSKFNLSTCNILVSHFSTHNINTGYIIQANEIKSDMQSYTSNITSYIHILISNQKWEELNTIINDTISRQLCSIDIYTIVIKAYIDNNMYESAYNMYTHVKQDKNIVLNTALGNLLLRLSLASNNLSLLSTQECEEIYTHLLTHNLADTDTYDSMIQIYNNSNNIHAIINIYDSYLQPIQPSNQHLSKISYVCYDILIHTLLAAGPKRGIEARNLFDYRRTILHTITTDAYFILIKGYIDIYNAYNIAYDLYKQMVNIDKLSINKIHMVNTLLSLLVKLNEYDIISTVLVEFRENSLLDIYIYMLLFREYMSIQQYNKAYDIYKQIMIHIQTSNKTIDSSNNTTTTNTNGTVSNNRTSNITLDTHTAHELLELLLILSNNKHNRNNKHINSNSKHINSSDSNKDAWYLFNYMKNNNLINIHTFILSIKRFNRDRLPSVVQEMYSVLMRGEEEEENHRLLSVSASSTHSSHITLSQAVAPAVGVVRKGGGGVGDRDVSNTTVVTSSSPLTELNNILQRGEGAVVRKWTRANRGGGCGGGGQSSISYNSSYSNNNVRDAYNLFKSISLQQRHQQPPSPPPLQQQQSVAPPAPPFPLPPPLMLDVDCYLLMIRALGSSNGADVSGRGDRDGNSRDGCSMVKELEELYRNYLCEEKGEQIVYACICGYIECITLYECIRNM